MKIVSGNPNQKQQGDVLCERIASIPEATKAKLKPVGRSHRGFILAEGETTGHAHTIQDNIQLFEEKETGKLFAENPNETPATITHEEHGPITLDKGIWEVSRVREYDAIRELERTVRD